MIHLVLTTLVFLGATCVSALPDPWGLPADGLRMSVTLTARDSSARQLEVTIQNIANKAVLLPIGTIVGEHAYAGRLRVFVTTAEGQDRRVIFTGGPGAIGGRVDSLVIPLLPEASYAIRTPVTRFYVLAGSEPLETILSRRGSLRVELDAQNPGCPLYGYPNPNMLECWQGGLVSNSLELPQQ